MPYKTPLTGGRWVTIEGEHVYIKKGAIVAGHVPSDTSKSTKSDVDKWVEEGHASRLFKPDDEVRNDSWDTDARHDAEADYEKHEKQFGNRSDLSEDHQNAITNYRGSGYHAVNEHLRLHGADYVPGDKPSPVPLGFGEEHSASNKSKLVQEAVTNSPATEADQVLYRHFSYDPKHEVGENIKSAGFLSTASLSQRGFMSSSSPFGYEIAVPKGSKGLLSGFNSGELETLIAHGANFKVLSKKELKFGVKYGDPQTRTIYQLAYLGHGKQS